MKVTHSSATQNKLSLNSTKYATKTVVIGNEQLSNKEPRVSHCQTSLDQPHCGWLTPLPWWKYWEANSDGLKQVAMQDPGHLFLPAEIEPIYYLSVLARTGGDCLLSSKDDFFPESGATKVSLIPTRLKPTSFNMLAKLRGSGTLRSFLPHSKSQFLHEHWGGRKGELTALPVSQPSEPEANSWMHFYTKPRSYCLSE